MPYSIVINGKRRSVDVEADTPLLWVIRDALALTGTKYGCGIGQCGACTVHVNDQPLRSCALPISAVGDLKITTIEGVTGREATAVREAWVAHDVPQCGFCQSGQIMSAVALLREVRQPTDKNIDESMNGNLCRCATYNRIRAAIHTAAGALQA